MTVLIRKKERNVLRALFRIQEFDKSHDIVIHIVLSIGGPQEVQVIEVLEIREETADQHWELKFQPFDILKKNRMSLFQPIR